MCAAEVGRHCKTCNLPWHTSTATVTTRSLTHIHTHTYTNTHSLPAQRNTHAIRHFSVKVKAKWRADCPCPCLCCSSEPQRRPRVGPTLCSHSSLSFSMSACLSVSQRKLSRKSQVMRNEGKSSYSTQKLSSLECEIKQTNIFPLCFPFYFSLSLTIWANKLNFKHNWIIFSWLHNKLNYSSTNNTFCYYYIHLNESFAKVDYGMQIYYLISFNTGQQDKRTTIGIVVRLWNFLWYI